MTRRPFARAGLTVALVCTIAFKLWLVRGEEIVGSATQYDALWYVRSASHWYWGAPYDWVAFIRPCAYPLWLALGGWLHFPQRLAIELLQLGGALVLVLGLRCLGLSRWICGASFALICLHPIGFQQNDYTMSDNFYAALLWYVVGGLFFTLATHRWWSALATGIAVAILWQTREEGILLVALLALWSVIFFLQEKAASVKPVVITFGTAILLTVLVYAVNDRVFRSFARSEMTAPAFQSLYHSLLRIRPVEPKGYAPITMDTLHRAFAVSPTLARLRGPLDGPLGEAWRVETMRRTGTPNEIGVGWIVWATRQAASVRGVFASPGKARKFFQKAAREIDAACAAGKLPTRFVLDGFLDPFVQSGGLRRLPGSAERVAGRAFAQWSIVPLPDDAGLTNTELRLYDQIRARASAGVPPRTGAAVFLEKLIARSHYLVMIGLHLLAAASVILLIFVRRRLPWPAGAASALVILAGAILSRAALLAWLDATAFDATQDRFLFPILPLWSALLVIVIALGLRAMPSPNEKKT